MGFKIKYRLIYIAICLIIASSFIYLRPSTKTPPQKKTLSESFTVIDQWKNKADINMEKEIFISLELDDYLFRSYQNNNNWVSLYIGYYRTTRKVGAAHSPLVCFPGQGWEITTPQKIKIECEDGQINVAKLIVHKGQQKELLLYWFQAYNMTSSGTFMQKVHNFWARMNSKSEDNAFVRVSVPIYNENINTAYETALAFIRDFYPHFLHYITT